MDRSLFACLDRNISIKMFKSLRTRLHRHRYVGSSYEYIKYFIVSRRVLDRYDSTTNCYYELIDAVESICQIIEFVFLAVNLCVIFWI